MVTNTTNNGNRNMLLIMLLLALVAVLLFAVVPHSHAVLRHGEDALSVRRCLDNNGPYMVFKRGNRYLLPCFIDELSMWGIQIVAESGDEITAYIKERFTSWGDMYKWLIKTGWTRYKGPLPWMIK